MLTGDKMQRRVNSCQKSTGLQEKLTYLLFNNSLT